MAQRKRHRSRKHHERRVHHPQRHVPWYSLKRSWGRALIIFACMAVLLLATYLLPSLIPTWICFAILAILVALGFFHVWKRWMKILFGCLTIFFIILECFAILLAINPTYFFTTLILIIALGVFIIVYIIRLLLIFLDNTAKWAGVGMGGAGGARIGWGLAGKLTKKR